MKENKDNKNNLQLVLETVTEEDESNFENNNNTNNNFTIYQAVSANKKINTKICNKDSKSEKQSTIFDTSFVLSPVFLSNEQRKSSSCSHGCNENTFNNSKDVTYKSALFATPIMLVNNIRNSFDSGDGENICISEQPSFSGSTIIRNLKRSSIESNSFSGKHVWYGVSLGTLIIMTTVIATMMVAWRPSQTVTTDGSRPYHHLDFYLNDSWFITRQDWNAFEPYSRTYLSLPVYIVIVGATNTRPVKTKAECIQKMRKIQKSDMEMRQWSDIGYNYVICGKENYVFDGRGANIMGSHTPGFNSHSIMIAIVGKFKKNKYASADAMNRVQFLINELRAHGKVAENYLLLGKSNVSPNLETPFKHIMKVMKNITRWSHP